MLVTTFDQHGAVIDITEVPDPEPTPLDAAGQTAALLAAKGLITEDEAASVSGHTKERLAAEVVAWAAAPQPTRTPKR